MICGGLDWKKRRGVFFKPTVRPMTQEQGGGKIVGDRLDRKEGQRHLSWGDSKNARGTGGGGKKNRSRKSGKKLERTWKARERSSE